MIDDFLLGIVDFNAVLGGFWFLGTSRPEARSQPLARSLQRTAADSGY
jgi:hypothetical protein